MEQRGSASGAEKGPPGAATPEGRHEKRSFDDNTVAPRGEPVNPQPRKNPTNYTVPPPDARPPARLADPVWSKIDAATALGVTPRTVEHLHRTHRLRGFVVAGRLRWRRSAVEGFARTCEEEGER